jgi:hypothetical protein
MQAVAAIALTNRVDAASQLAPILLDPDVDVLHAAAAALAEISTEDAVDSLLHAARNKSLPMVRRVAATLALGSVRVTRQRVRFSLRRLARASDPWLRATARESLERQSRRAIAVPR